MAQRTVLVVDDGLDTREIWRAVFQHHGHLVLQAADGAEGVRAAMARSPDVVVMDLEMRGLDGLQATRHLKEHRLTSAMPVIVVSAHAGAEYRERAGAAGCDGCLAKPCPPAELLGEVERVLGGLLATAERRGEPPAAQPPLYSLRAPRFTSDHATMASPTMRSTWMKKLAILNTSQPTTHRTSSRIPSPSHLRITLLRGRGSKPLAAHGQEPFRFAETSAIALRT